MQLGKNFVPPRYILPFNIGLGSSHTACPHTATALPRWCFRLFWRTLSPAQQVERTEPSMLKNMENGIKPDKKGSNNHYWGSAKEAIYTTLKGAQVTFRHLKDALSKKRHSPNSANDEAYFSEGEGIVTLNYPYEAIPIPDNGRYRLHNEIEDCIVCDKCAKVCPVDCIDIEAIKSDTLIGNTSDGTPKRLYAAKFDIDMAKCCYCGLCTTVCPTECLTMTKTFDYSEFDIDKMNYHFAELSEEEAKEKQQAYELAQEQKKAAQLAKKQAAEQPGEAEKPSAKARPAFKPRPRPKAAPPNKESQGEGEAKKPTFKPRVRPKISKQPKSEEQGLSQKPSDEQDGKERAAQKSERPKRVRPVIKKKDRPDKPES